MPTPLLLSLLLSLSSLLQEPQPEPGGRTVVSVGGVTTQEPAPTAEPAEPVVVEIVEEIEEIEEVEVEIVEEVEGEIVVELELTEVQEAVGKRPLDMESAEYWGSASGAQFSDDGQWIRWNHNPAGKDAENVLHVRAARGTQHYAIERASSAQFTTDSRYLVYLEAPEKKDGEGEEEAAEEAAPAPGPRGPRGGFGGGAPGGARGGVVRSLVMLELATGVRTEIPRVRSFSMPEEAADRIAYVPAPPEEKPAETAEAGAEGAAPAAARGGRRGGRGTGGRPGGARPARPGRPMPGEEPARPNLEPAAEPAAPAAEPVAATPAEPAAEPVAAAPAVQEPAPAALPGATEGEAQEEEKKPKTSRNDGDDLIVRMLADGSEQKLEKVSWHRFTKDGSQLLYVTSTKDEGGDGLWLRDVAAATSRALLEGEGDYRNVTLSDDETRIALLTNLADFQAEEPANEVYYGKLADEELYAVVSDGHPGMPDGYRVGSGGLGFSESGARLYFQTAPPEPEEVEELPADEKVELDVWAWTDEALQPQQLRSVSRDRNPTYQAVIHVDKVGRVVTLEDETLSGVSIPVGRDAKWGLASDDSAWARMRSWETDLPSDVYLVNVESGKRRLILPAAMGSPRFSPGGAWLSWFDPRDRQYWAMQVPDGTPRCISADIPYPLENELQDTPQMPRAYGTAGWLQDDAGLLVYDAHDLWLLDPSGATPAVCVTEGVGRARDLRFRRIDVDPESEGGGGGNFRGFGGFGGGASDGIDPAKPLWLSAFHLTAKSDGWWQDSFAGGEPVELLTMDKSLSTPNPAKEGGLMTYTRSDFREYPDIWLTDLDLSFHEKLSNANPQQDEFLWGDAELFAWNSTDGIPLQGLLIKPEGFDPTRKYPMVVYFYERMSDGLHQHRSPGPGGSSVAFPYYASNGFLVFVPDIPYRIGYPGESAENAILPAIGKLIDTGFVDADAIGVQGHSWGGYQIAHLVTRTNIFTAAISGAPVSNMVSAYGGIRWSSGMSRMFQYERTQSRLGGTLWEVPMRFLENSPIFYMDKVETPVLILHNDQDGAVPWYQGIEFFVALRRLDKPGWLLNYNGEDHGLRKAQNKRDYATRMFQFFDHYLRGAPMPVWMHDGIPAKDKGRTLGLDYVPGTGRDGR